MLRIARANMRRIDKKLHKNATPPDPDYSKLDIAPFKGADDQQCYDIYYAKNPNGVTVLDIHGGAYIYSSRKNNRFFANALNEMGFNVVCLDYRLNHGHLSPHEQIRDLGAEIVHLFKHAEEYGLDPNRFVLTGDSAGGHFALFLAEAFGDENVAKTVGLDFTGLKIRCVAANCPVYDLVAIGKGDSLTKSGKKFMMGKTAFDLDCQALVCPRHNVEALKMPLMVTTAYGDFLQQESLTLKEDYERLGKPLEFIDIEDPEIGHVHNVIRLNLEASKQVNEAMAAFFLKHASK